MRERTISFVGSKAPVFTFPAWTQTMVLPSKVGRRRERMRPCRSAGTFVTRARLARVHQRIHALLCSMLRVAEGHDAGEVGHCRAVDKSDGSGSRQAEKIAKPSKNNFFQLRGDRRHDAQRDVLIPCSTANLRRAPPGGFHL